MNKASFVTTWVLGQDKGGVFMKLATNVFVEALGGVLDYHERF